MSGVSGVDYQDLMHGRRSLAFIDIYIYIYIYIYLCGMTECALVRTYSLGKTETV